MAHVKRTYLDIVSKFDSCATTIEFAAVFSELKRQCKRDNATVFHATHEVNYPGCGFFSILPMELIFAIADECVDFQPLVDFLKSDLTHQFTCDIKLPPLFDAFPTDVGSFLKNEWARYVYETKLGGKFTKLPRKFPSYSEMLMCLFQDCMFVHETHEAYRVDTIWKYGICTNIASSSSSSSMFREQYLIYDLRYLFHTEKQFIFDVLKHSLRPKRGLECILLMDIEVDDTQFVKDMCACVFKGRELSIHDFMVKKICTSTSTTLCDAIVDNLPALSLPDFTEFLCFLLRCGTPYLLQRYVSLRCLPEWVSIDIDFYECEYQYGLPSMAFLAIESNITSPLLQVRHKSWTCKIPLSCFFLPVDTNDLTKSFRDHFQFGRGSCYSKERFERALSLAHESLLKCSKPVIRSFFYIALSHFGCSRDNFSTKEAQYLEIKRLLEFASEPLPGDFFFKLIWPQFKPAVLLEIMAHFEFQSFITDTGKSPKIMMEFVRKSSRSNIEVFKLLHQQVQPTTETRKTFKAFGELLVKYKTDKPKAPVQQLCSLFN